MSFDGSIDMFPGWAGPSVIDTDPVVGSGRSTSPTSHRTAGVSRLGTGRSCFIPLPGAALHNDECLCGFKLEFAVIGGYPICVQQQNSSLEELSSQRLALLGIVTVACSTNEAASSHAARIPWREA